jgi:hypothetical protein
MKYVTLILFLLSFNVQFAQYQRNTWYFSSTTKGLQFDLTTNIPSVVNGHTPFSSLHGCGVATNPSTGNVMFYTDGVNVYDSDNLQMPNGTGLLSGTSCAQKGRIVMAPGACDKYYIFCNTADDPTSGSVYYSIVDMSLTGNGTSTFPKGDVETASKNLLIANSSTEALTIIPNPNGNYWLLIPLNTSDAIRIYSITSSGIFYISTFNTGTTIAGSFAIKYSKEAGKIAYISVVENQPALLLDFNSNTGILSGVVSIAGTPLGTNTSHYYGFHDVEFSPDGTKLYLSKYRLSSPAGAGRIYQYDLNNLSLPIVPIYSIPSTDVSKSCTGLQTGPDGKLYFIYINLTYSDDRLIGSINSPNISGTGCNVNPAALDLGISQSNNSRFPEFIDYFIAPVTASNSNVTIVSSCQTGYGTINIFNPLNPNSISVINTIHGNATLISGDSIHYISDPEFIGMDTISYQVCDTGCFSKCDTGYIFVSVQPCGTGISDNSIENGTFLFPNPNNGSFTINCNKTNDMNLELYNAIGEQIYQEKLHCNVNLINLETLSEGIYLIIIGNKEIKKSHSLIIQH